MSDNQNNANENLIANSRQISISQSNCLKNPDFVFNLHSTPDPV